MHELYEQLQELCFQQRNYQPFCWIANFYKLIGIHKSVLCHTF